MAIYCWKLVSSSDPHDQDMVGNLQFAVVHTLCDSFVEGILRLTPGQTESWPLTPIPQGSPHHLDTQESYNEPCVEYQQLIIQRDVQPNDLLSVYIQGEVVTIKTGAEGLERLTKAIRKSCSMGYYRDTFVDIMIGMDNCEPYVAQMVLWGTEDNEIIFY